LTGWACTTSFTLVASVVLDVAMPIFFGSGNGYFSMLQSLQSYSLAPSLSFIVPTNITNGSISSSTTISIQDSSDNAAVLASYNGLQTGLSSGTLGGATVLSFSITADGGDIPVEGVNLALILGITIPLGIIRNLYN
jgi:hypothetical protein